MKAAVVFDLQQGPVWSDFSDPRAGESEALVKVRAAAISHVVKGRASGKHYSFDGRLPFVPGIDGAGVLPDGRRVYFAFPAAPWGSMAQWAPVALNHCLPRPDELDDITAAPMANPGKSAWAALVKPEADAIVNLSQEEASLRAQFAELAAQQIDGVVDYLWGRSAELLLPALAKHSPGNTPVRFIQVGSLSAADIALSGAVLRSAPLQLMGSGIGSLSVSQLLAATGEMLQAAVTGGFTIATTPRPLREVAAAWPQDNSQKRTVFIVA